MKVMDWELVKESTPGDRLPPGGYVARIVDASDVPEKEYLWIVYDVAEGEHSGHYSDDFGKRNQWAHRFSRSYKESAKGMFKAFLNRLEESNRGRFSVSEWQRRSDERDLVGLEVGIVLQKRLYTNDRGEDKEALEVRGVYASQDIRSGDYRMPEPRDERQAVPTVPAPAPELSGDYGADVPF